VAGQRGVECGEGLLVEPDEQLRGGRRRADLVEEDFEGRVGDRLQAQGGLAHLTDPAAEGLDVLGAKVGVVRECGLQLVDRLGGDPGREDLVEPLEGVVIPLQTRDTRLDREAGPGRLLDRGQARQGREPAVGLIGLGHEVHPRVVERTVRSSSRIDAPR
jgi:hypothetical protein